MSSPNSGNSGIGFQNDEIYEKRENGKGFRKKEKFSITREADLVDAFSTYLYNKNIDYKLEYSIKVGDDKRRIIDVYIPEFELAVECKKSDGSNYMPRGIEQCKDYNIAGYTSIMLVPSRPSVRKDNKYECQLREEGIVFMEFNPKEKGVKVVHTCGKIEPLYIV